MIQMPCIGGLQFRMTNISGMVALVLVAAHLRPGVHKFCSRALGRLVVS